MMYDERESRARLLEELADDLLNGSEFLAFFNTLKTTPPLKEAVSLWLQKKAEEQRNPARRRRSERPAPHNIPEQEQPVWPPDPSWGIDPRGRFHYEDYDGEALVVWKAGDSGDLWMDKSGEGPVLVKAEHIDIIAGGMRGTIKS